ncbi:MAG TPA: enoyl-CoA hydratase [Solirubrobacteraceae bacterium]|jgi:2-(1,2-epoxy-1,2-dihydrophenyl)acetyl-CoA isomerase
MTTLDLDTGSEELLARVEDGVATVTFNRPARRNALTPAMLDALAGVLARLEADDDVGCVVLTGTGGAFCAGGDVKAMAEGEGADVPFHDRVARQRRNHRETAGRLHRMPKPTVAALPGPAAGAGLSLALACDLRYAASNAFLTTAFADVGLAGDYGGTWFLTQLVGPALARELYFLPRRIDAAEALALHLINGVEEPDALDGAVAAVARRLAAGPRVALGYMKENLNRALTAELEDCLDIEATHHLSTGETADHAEAARAFTEKRRPEFRGR